MIYREEVYEPETPRKGIADIIIAKQRNGPTGEVHLTFLGKYTRFENLATGDYELRRLSRAGAAHRREAPDPHDRRHRGAAPQPRARARDGARVARHGGHQGERLRPRLVPAAKALAPPTASRWRGSRKALALRAAGARQSHPAARGRVQPGAARDRRAARLRPDGAQRRAARDARGAAGAEPISAWIKVDTGMNRLGFRVEQFAEAYARLGGSLTSRRARRSSRTWRARTSVATRKTGAQLQAFEAATARAARRAQHRQLGGAARLARRRTATGCGPGLVLYGVSPFPDGTGADLGLRAGDDAADRGHRGQGRAGGRDGGLWRRVARAARDTRMAVVAAGYGDGYPRSVRVRHAGDRQRPARAS